jgi:hypothetical protein
MAQIRDITYTLDGDEIGDALFHYEVDGDGSGFGPENEHASALVDVSFCGRPEELYAFAWKVLRAIEPDISAQTVAGFTRLGEVVVMLEKVDQD